MKKRILFLVVCITASCHLYAQLTVPKLIVEKTADITLAIPDSSQGQIKLLNGQLNIQGSENKANVIIMNGLYDTPEIGSGYHGIGILFQRNGDRRWYAGLNSNQGEKGGDSGSNYTIMPYSEETGRNKTPVLVATRDSKIGINTRQPKATVEIQSLLETGEEILKINSQTGGGRVMTIYDKEKFVGGLDYNYANNLMSIDVAKADGNRRNDAFIIRSETDSNFIGIGTQYPVRELEIMSNTGKSIEIGSFHSGVLFQMFAEDDKANSTRTGFMAQYDNTHSAFPGDIEFRNLNSSKFNFHGKNPGLGSVRMDIGMVPGGIYNYDINIGGRAKFYAPLAGEPATQSNEFVTLGQLSGLSSGGSGAWLNNNGLLSYNAGYVGIGTTTPTADVHVKDTLSPATVVIERSDGAAGSIAAGSASSNFRFDNQMRFSIQSQDRAGILSGIGGEPYPLKNLFSIYGTTGYTILGGENTTLPTNQFHLIPQLGDTNDPLRVEGLKVDNAIPYIWGADSSGVVKLIEKTNLALGNGIWTVNNLDAIYNKGNIGIGLDNPTAPIHIFKDTISNGIYDLGRFEGIDGVVRIFSDTRYSQGLNRVGVHVQTFKDDGTNPIVMGTHIKGDTYARFGFTKKGNLYWSSDGQSGFNTQLNPMGAGKLKTQDFIVDQLGIGTEILNGNLQISGSSGPTDIILEKTNGSVMGISAAGQSAAVRFSSGSLFSVQSQDRADLLAGIGDTGISTKFSIADNGNVAIGYNEFTGTEMQAQVEGLSNLFSVNGSGYFKDKIGIGISPERDIHVHDGASPSNIMFTNDNSGATIEDGVVVGLGSNGIDGKVVNYEEGPIILSSNHAKDKNVANLTLQPNKDAVFGAKVGIGINNPETKLHIKGDLMIEDSTGQFKTKILTRGSEYGTSVTVRNTEEGFMQFSVEPGLNSTSNISFLNALNSSNYDLGYGMARLGTRDSYGVISILSSGTPTTPIQNFGIEIDRNNNQENSVFEVGFNGAFTSSTRLIDKTFRMRETGEVAFLKYINGNFEGNSLVGKKILIIDENTGVISSIDPSLVNLINPTATQHQTLVKPESQSVAKGVKFPNYPNTIAISNPDLGETIFDLSDKKLKTWDGTTWQAHW